MIAPDVAEIIERELNPGEELLWADKPRRVPQFISLAALLIVLAFILNAIVALGTIANDPLTLFTQHPLDTLSSIRTAWSDLTPTDRSAYETNAHFFGLLLGIVFIILGINTFYILTERYAITDRRVIFLSKLGLYSINPWAIKGVFGATNHKIGVVGLSVPPRKLMKILSPLSLSSQRTFYEIRNPKEVERLLIERFAPATQGNPS